METPLLGWKGISGWDRFGAEDPTVCEGGAGFPLLLHILPVLEGSNWDPLFFTSASKETLALWTGALG